ncbi:hypothetical protein BDZ97DRAFT_40031 [Flammula alnicola]|nr:hypothetical protein BDZ97DRAFT_40031 [Flammula alnicola]
MMPLCGSTYHGGDFPLNGSLANCTTPPFSTTYSMTSTPLILPRGWSDNYYPPSTLDPLGNTYDFQSNHLETSRLHSGIIPSLAGLGISNVDLNKELEIKESCGLDGFIQPQTQERRHSHRPLRTNSIYDVSEELNHSSELYTRQGYCTSGLSSPWSFSSILEAAELAATNAVSEMELLLSSGLDLVEAPALTSQLPHELHDTEEDVAWSFEKLSAATGLSVADFAAQISATAEVTLKRMAAGNDFTISETSSFGTVADSGQPATRRDDLQGNSESSIWPPISTRTPDLVLPLVDINMRTLDTSWNYSCAGINPADILPASPSPLPPAPLVTNPGRIFLVNPADSALSSESAENLPDHAVHIQSYDVDLDLEQSILGPDPGSPYHGSYALPFLKSSSQDIHQASDDEPFRTPSSSEYSPSLQPLGMKRNYSRVNARKISRSRDPDTTEMTLEYPNDADQQALPPVDLGTPVFDAHRGIDIEELKAKAERYRLRNQGRDYDKRWLISFAGKLSARGELVEEFRCYVAGCKQANKRRDHILIHVGAHLDQRPFKCMHCSSRFLRKNECKRHELSHTGIRPFSCHLCPAPATTFVRQDLLKRHMKRTHRLDFKADKENEEPRRPKKRARY